MIEFRSFEGSGREEIQKAGRLMNLIVRGKIHAIISTMEELEKSGKRLYGLYEKGFRCKLIRHVTGVSSQQTSSEKKTVKSTRDTVILKEIFKEGYLQRKDLSTK